MSLFSVKGASKEALYWGFAALLLLGMARCDSVTVCSLCGETGTPTPINVNIFDKSNGFFLWINSQNKLSNGAVDAGDGSSIFEIHLYDADDPTSVWIKAHAFESSESMVLAADFSADPSIVVVKEGTADVVAQFRLEGAETSAKSVFVTDPSSGTKLYWSIDPTDSTTVILSPQQAPIFVIQERRK